MRLLDTLREQRAAKLAELEALGAEARDLTDSESATFASLTEGIRSIDARIDELEAIESRSAKQAAAVAELGKIAPAIVTSEARTYSKESGHSFFADLAASKHDSEARARIERHGNEARTIDGTNGAEGLLIPRYIQEEMKVLRAPSAYINGVSHQPLPQGVSSFKLPMIDQTKTQPGDSVADRALGGTPAQGDLHTRNVDISVYTVAGSAAIDLATIQQSAYPVEAIVTKDLAVSVTLDHNRKAITALLAAGHPTVAVADQSVQSLLDAVAIAEADVATTLFAQPSRLVMTPKRWAWLKTRRDNAGRPLVEVYAGIDTGILGQANGASLGVVGSFAGYPVVVDANLPANLGTNHDEDVVVVEKADEQLAFDGDLYTRVIPLANMSNLYQVFGFGAFTSDRYPTSVQVITGLTTPFAA